MRIVNIHWTTVQKDFVKLYENLLSSYEGGITLAGDIIHFNNNFAKGEFTFNPLIEDMVLFTVNIFFNETVCFKTIATSNPDYYYCMFSLKENSDRHTFNNIDTEEMQNIGLSVRYSIFFCSSDIMSSLFKATPTENSKSIILVFSKDALTRFIGSHIIEELPGLFTGGPIKGYSTLSAQMIDLLNFAFEFDYEPGLKTMYLSGIAYQLLSLLIHQIKAQNEKLISETQVAEVARMIQVRNLLLNDFSKDCPTIENMAKAVHMSSAKFKQVFKTIFKMPYYRYYQHYRLLAAKQYLAMGNSATETAYEFGFASLSHFSMAFKKKFNQLPSDIS